ncbi:MAG: YggT family protein, partial [Microbacterium chocolatum]|nr:YggT family protein [Microbacterium chocolatum]
MAVVQLIASILNFLLLLYVFVLFARLVLEWIPIFNREWRPRGAGLVAAEVVYTVTDPP